MPGIEKLLEEVITEVTMYMTPGGELFHTKIEAVTYIIAIACPHGDSEKCREYRRTGGYCRDCKIGDFLK